jgi:hypothetical protein
MGCLEIVTRVGSRLFEDEHSDLKAAVAVHDDRFYERVIPNGEIGAGKSRPSSLLSNGGFRPAPQAAHCACKSARPSCWA